MNMIVLLLIFAIFANALSKPCDFKKSIDDGTIEFKGIEIASKNPSSYLGNMFRYLFNKQPETYCLGEWKMISKHDGDDYKLVYHGEIKNGMPHGIGENTMISHYYPVDDFTANYYYIGDWANGYKQGHGLQQVTFLDKNKNPYIITIQSGNFMNNDVIEGTEFSYTIDKNVCSEYHGNFLHNRPHGYGSIHYNNGTIFQGEFENGKIVKIDYSNTPFSMEQLSTLSWNYAISEIPTTTIQQYDCVAKMLHLQQK